MTEKTQSPSLIERLQALCHGGFDLDFTVLDTVSPECRKQCLDAEELAGEAYTQISKLTYERSRALNLLRQLEWTGHNGYCPCCGGWISDDGGCGPDRHSANCELAAILKHD